MCGIAGIVNFRQRPVPEARIRAAAQVIRHRGPDNLGLWQQDSVALGHTRLSIVDLSAGANQPFHLPERDLTLTYNGEIYNFVQLRAELTALGASFRTTSDTEVVINAFAHWGMDCFARFNGIFAIAIWDQRAGELVLARDRLGVKPLYLFRDDSELVFGSEIKSILAARPERPWRANAAALHEFLYYGVPLGGKTLFEGIEQLLPAHALRISRRGDVLESKRFWSYPTQTADHYGVDETVSKATQLLEQAVSRQLTGDVPIGIFLSGGLDSSCITAFASRNYAGKLATFSVGFDFAPTNELALARQVADRYQTDHHEIRIAGVGLEETVEKLVQCHDAPFADAANVPLYLLCEQVSGQFKVILQGDGGDELFGGYRRYATLAKLRRFRTLAQALRVPGLAKRLPWRIRRYLECFTSSQRALVMAKLLTLETTSTPPTSVLTDELQRAVAPYDPFQRYFAVESSLSKQEDDVGAMLATDMQIILPDVFLEKVDRSTMAHGVEVRVPLLENDLVDFIAGLPTRLKLRDGEQKWLLKKAIREVVPADVISGKKKGFGVPYSEWLRQPLNALLHKRIETLIARGFVQQSQVEPMLRDHAGGSEQHAFLLWKLMNLGIWVDRYDVQPPRSGQADAATRPVPSRRVTA